MILVFLVIFGNFGKFRKILVIFVERERKNKRERKKERKKERERDRNNE